MTAAEFHEALRRLGFATKPGPQSGVRAAARWYGVAPSTVRGWLIEGPGPVADRHTRLVLALGRTPAEIDAMIR